MRILFVHNFYQLEGGEDTVYRNEIAMLRNAGHDVDVFSVHNDSIKSTWDKVKALIGIVFSFRVYKSLLLTLRKLQPDVVHVHNYFPLMSPSVFYACSKAGVPVVHTLHNFRAICPTALLMHEGKIIEKSIVKGPWWAVTKTVYRDSLLGTLALATMISFHKKVGTWRRTVDGFICLTDFAKQTYVRSGWPEEKIYIKPNFLNDNYAKQSSELSALPNRFALYVGRLSKEKGIDRLLQSWKELNFPLVIIGDGPEKQLLENSPKNVIYLGPKPKNEVLECIEKAQFLIMASTWFEGFPMVLVEAFSKGTCALVPNIGSMAEVVIPNKNGMHFDATKSDSLRLCALELINAPSRCKELGENAKDIFYEKYSEKVNYQQLHDIYTNIILNKYSKEER